MQPTLGIFLARDPWSGDVIRSGSMNGFGYGLGNPVKYTDPSGMVICEDSNSLACRIRASFLHTKAYLIKQSVTAGELLPVEGFAQLIDYAMPLFDYDIRGMLWGTTHVINGMEPNNPPLWRQGPYSHSSSPYFIEPNWLPYRNEPAKNKLGWKHSLRGDWRKEYWDKTAGQAYHFWFYVAVRYFDGMGYADFGNWGHDQQEYWEDYDFINSPEDEAPPPSGISKPDYDLGNKAIQLGDALAEAGALQDLIYPRYCRADIKLPKPDFDPAAWIRANLKE
ncbi:hypothetical protein TFLX_06569 [Thermoflexales bacterium]|nr:hypothetical protein TFLX_06569 [Thermoflexales bacterium]